MTNDELISDVYCGKMTLNSALCAARSDELANNSSVSPSPFACMVGKNVFIRTVTHHFTGKIEKVDGQVIWLSSCAWIADSGRYADFLRTGIASEIEPYPADLLVAVNVGGLVDLSEFRHALPRDQK